MTIKQKKGLLLTAVLSFCLVCQITLCTTFQTFWRRNVVTSLVPAIFSASKPFLDTAGFTHNEMFSFGRRQGSFGVVSFRTLLDTFSGWASNIVLSVVATAVERVAMTGPVFPSSKGKSFLLEDSRHVTVVLSLFRLWGQFQVELPSRCPILDRSALPSLFLPAGLPLPAFLHFSFLLILQKSTDDAQGEFKLHWVPNCVCFTKRLRGRSCLHKARPRLLNILSNHVQQHPSLGFMLLW